MFKNCLFLSYLKNPASRQKCITQKFFFLNLCSGSLGTAATTGLLYQPWIIGDSDCKEIGGMKIGRGN
jgi:hypothetical protein